MTNIRAFSGGAFDPPHLSHLKIAAQVVINGLADCVHMGPSGVRPDKAYKTSIKHRKRMMEIMLEEHPELGGSVIPDFDFIDAPREKSAAYGVDTWFQEKYQTSPKQVFGTDVIPNIWKFWMKPGWVWSEAKKIFIPRPGTPIDYSDEEHGNMSNYEIMPYTGTHFLQSISSSSIRARIPEGDFRGLPGSVAEYIAHQGLYLPKAPTNRVSMHVSARVEGLTQADQPNTYPQRLPIPADKRSWSIPYTQYSPPYFEDENLEGCHLDPHHKGNRPAHPDEYEDIGKTYTSYEGPIIADENGRPLNPYGRTGIAGRGELYYWGANFAADPIVTGKNPDTGNLEILLVYRTRDKKWALPGGMVDFGESGSQAACRELNEEAGISKEQIGKYFDTAPIIYQGYVNDKRNTDHAWIETSVVHVHLPDDDTTEFKPKPDGKETKDAKWFSLTDPVINDLYADHTKFVKKAVENIPHSQFLVITAPEPCPEKISGTKIFLGGSIENDRAERWQDEVIQRG